MIILYVRCIGNLNSKRCGCNGRVSLGVYCCSWWLLFAAVGMVFILGALSVLLVTLNSVSTEVVAIEGCEIILLVYGVLSVFSGVTFFCAYATANVLPIIGLS